MTKDEVFKHWAKGTPVQTQQFPRDKFYIIELKGDDTAGLSFYGNTGWTVITTWEELS